MGFIEIADGVFCRRYDDWLDQTIGLIRTEDGPVLVDSRSHRGDALELRDELARIDPRPPEVVINTHYHWDHSFGNEAFPEALIVGHRRCRRALVERGAAMIEELTAAEWVSAELAGRFAEVVVTPPEVVFDRSLSLYPGGTEITLEYLGRGHTDSDLVVEVAGVVFAGDLVEVGAPPSFGDSYPRAWVETLARLVDRCRGPVVPGHGDVTDGAFVEAQRGEIAAAVDGDTVYPPAVMAEIARRLEVETEGGPLGQSS